MCVRVRIHGGPPSLFLSSPCWEANETGGEPAIVEVGSGGGRTQR